MPVCQTGTSLVGQTRHFGRAPMTSGLPRQADILSACRHVSNVPLPEVKDRLTRWKTEPPKASANKAGDPRVQGYPSAGVPHETFPAIRRSHFLTISYELYMPHSG